MNSRSFLSPRTKGAGAHGDASPPDSDGTVRPTGASGRRGRSTGGGAARALWLVSTPLLALALALLFLLTSGALTGREATYPRVLAVVVAVLAVVSLWRDSVEARREKASTGPAAPATKGDESDELDDEDPEGRRGAGLAVGRIIVLVAVTAVAIYLMGLLGFFIPAALLVGGGLVVLGVRSPWRVAAYTAGLVIGAYLLFVEALRVPFPATPWS